MKDTNNRMNNITSNSDIRNPLGNCYIDVAINALKMEWICTHNYADNVVADITAYLYGTDNSDDDLSTYLMNNGLGEICTAFADIEDGVYNLTAYFF